MANFELPSWRTPDQIVNGERRALQVWFDNPSPDEAVLIAEIDSHAVGCAYLVVDTDFFTAKAHAHLSVLAVAEGAEGRGVGSALIEASSAWAVARGDDHITLNVFAGNRRAQALYERHGYIKEIVRYVKPL